MGAAAGPSEACRTHYCGVLTRWRMLNAGETRSVCYICAWMVSLTSLQRAISSLSLVLSANHKRAQTQICVSRDNFAENAISYTKQEVHQDADEEFAV